MEVGGRRQAAERRGPGVHGSTTDLGRAHFMWRARKELEFPWDGLILVSRVLVPNYCGIEA